MSCGSHSADPDMGPTYRESETARSPATGTFTGVAFDPGCSVPAGTTAPDSADGTWRVNLHASKATGRFVINVPAGVPHVAWTTQMTRVSDEATTFTAQAQSPAGTLTVTLLEDGSFTYRISPYNESGVLPGWPVCTGTNGVTYSGELGSAG